MRRRRNHVNAALVAGFFTAATAVSAARTGPQSQHFIVLALATAVILGAEGCWYGQRLIERHAANQRARRIAEDMYNHRQWRYQPASSPVRGHRPPAARPPYRVALIERTQELPHYTHTRR